MKNRGVFVQFGLGLVGGVIMSKAQKNGLEYGYRVIFGVDQSTHSSSRRSVGAVGTVNGAVACKQVRTGAGVHRSAQLGPGAFSIVLESSKSDCSSTALLNTPVRLSTSWCINC